MQERRATARQNVRLGLALAAVALGFFAVFVVQRAL